jgi:very-short-patch-repair endonuclease
MRPNHEIVPMALEQYGAFHHDQAIAVGFTPAEIRYRIRAGYWVVLHRAVYAIAGAPPSRERDTVAAILAAGNGAVASHTTAAFFLGLVEVDADDVHVSVKHATHRTKRRGVVVHQARTLARRDIEKGNGIWLTGPHRTLVDLAGLLSFTELEAALDTALYERLVSVPSLRRYIASRRLGNNRGMGRLRRLMEDRTKGVPHSELERYFERLRKRFGLPEPVRQYPEGKRKIDYAYPAERIAIELDSMKHHGTGPAFQRDRTRQNELVLAGWDPYLFTKRDLTVDAERTAAILTQALSQARVTVVATANL